MCQTTNCTCFTAGRIRTGGFPSPLLSLLFTFLPLQQRLLTPPTVKGSYIIYCLTLRITVWLWKTVMIYESGEETRTRHRDRSLGSSSTFRVPMTLQRFWKSSYQTAIYWDVTRAPPLLLPNSSTILKSVPEKLNVFSINEKIWSHLQNWPRYKVRLAINRFFSKAIHSSEEMEMHLSFYPNTIFSTTHFV